MIAFTTFGEAELDSQVGEVVDIWTEVLFIVADSY